MPLRARVAVTLVLLYAHPSRIVRLTIDDITVRLGDPPSPLPEPVADLMRCPGRGGGGARPPARCSGPPRTPP
ncbi:hypothetical protein ACFWI9_14170, partial [Streptomyces sp. NPDC127084]